MDAVAHKAGAKRGPYNKARTPRKDWRYTASQKREFVPPTIDRPEWGLTEADVRRACKKCVPGYDAWKGAKGYRFDAELGLGAVMWIYHNLAHVKGPCAKKAFKLEPWEIAIVGNLFGWVGKKDGLRRYRESLIFVPRKNGKTPLAACIILLVLFNDDEYGMEIYGAASAYKQACKVFDHARGMVLMNPALSDNCQIFKGQAKSIEVHSSLSNYSVISAEPESAHGGNTHCAVIDELHTLPDSELVDTLMTSTGARSQPLIVMITTSDYEREGSVCNDKHRYACKVRDGITDDASFLPVIYEASMEDDWTSKQTWRKANPNLGVSLSMEYIERECKRAQESTTYENTFKRLHLNIRTQQDVRWIRMDRWDACDGNVSDLDGCACYAGLDLATTADVAAFVMLFPDRGNAVIANFWIPRENAIERSKRDRVPYLDWEAKGLITLTGGDVTDYEIIRRDINILQERYNIVEIAVDRWNSAQLQCNLGDDGFSIVQFGQGMASLSAPTKELERMVLGGNFAHGGNPILRWMASNVSVEMDAAGNIKPQKKKTAEKIDGIVALIMAIGRATVSDTDASSFEGRGLLRI